MIKEKLMKALKKAASSYNGGMSANEAVSSAADEFDFNEKQAERLVEMFNTLATINKEKDAEDPTGNCELASKSDVIKDLIGNCAIKKTASDSVLKDYSFYSSSPERSNNSLDARHNSMCSCMKSACVEHEDIPEELLVSQRSLYKIIHGKIDLLKEASSAADDVVRNLRLSIEESAIKIAKEIEYLNPDMEAADMFKAACKSEHAVCDVSEYSTKVANSDGGRFSMMNVIDTSPIEGIMKSAEDIELSYRMIPEYERKRDFYMEKASEAEIEMMKAVGLFNNESPKGISDMFIGIPKTASSDDHCLGSAHQTGLGSNIRDLIDRFEIGNEGLEKYSEFLEKDSAFNFSLPILSKAQAAYGALSAPTHIDNDLKRMLNVRRSVILADLMTNDPIIRDADPNTVAEAYKTMVMSSPRVSLDKSQVRAFLRTAVNSVAISPSDVKIITDVDKGTSMSNVDNLTHIDSSIKDSNA